MIPRDNLYWITLDAALAAALPSLQRLKPPIISTIHLLPSSGGAERCRITLFVHTEHDLQLDEKEHVIQLAKPIIESHLLSRSYPANAIQTFEYGVMYANSSRNSETVRAALNAVAATLKNMSPSVVSTYCLGPLSGEPDDFEIYLGFITKEDACWAERGLKENIKAVLEKDLCVRGYSRDAVGTFSYRFVCQQDVDQAGGWYGFLR